MKESVFIPKIVIFDSGVGGLTIYQSIKQQLPNATYIFVSDNAAFPYGTKSDDDLITRVTTVINNVVDRYNPDLIVIACNTASTIVLPILRNKLEISVIGVVPAIKPAAELTKSKTIGLLATPATINRAYTNELIDEFAADCTVIRVGSSRLVEIAEGHLYGDRLNVSNIETELQPLLLHKKLDTLILACTHFPLLNKEIEYIFKSKNHHAELIDSALGVTNRVMHVLSQIFDKKNNFSKTEQSNSGSSFAVFTLDLAPTSAFTAKLKQLGFSTIETLS